MKNTFSRIFLVMVLAFTLGMSVQAVQAQSEGPKEDPYAQGQAQKMSLMGGVSPTPMFMVIAANVRIGGMPAKPGTGVEIYCGNNLAGYGETYDYNQEYFGILGYTHVYGSDYSVQPPIYGCDDNDLLKIYINGLRAVYSPEIRWKNDWLNSPIIDLNLDLSVNYLWSGNEDVVSLQFLDEPSSIRTWFNNSPYYDEVFVQAAPFWKNYPALSVKSHSITDTLGRTYLFADHDPVVCPSGPKIEVTKGGEFIKVKGDNTTNLTLQIILTLGNTSAPSGRIYGQESGFEIQTDSQWGRVDLLVGDEEGPVCSSFVWDFRILPAPQILKADLLGEDENGRTVNILGNNLFPYMGIDYDPENLIVWFIDENGSSSAAYNINAVWSLKGKWEWRQIIVPLPDGFEGGEYLIKVSVAGVVSKPVKISIKDAPQKFLFYFPSILK